MTDDTEWTCADCDHVQRGHRFHCEKCGHNFGTVAVGDWDKGYNIGFRAVQAAIKAATIERLRAALDYIEHLDKRYGDQIPWKIVGLRPPKEMLPIWRGEIVSEQLTK